MTSPPCGLLERSVQDEEESALLDEASAVSVSLAEDAADAAAALPGSPALDAPLVESDAQQASQSSYLVRGLRPGTDAPPAAAVASHGVGDLYAEQGLV